MQLSNLIPAGKKRKRIGRGGSRGGTSGKGNKGQKARSGPTLGLVFEGGQMPLSRRFPKRGFNNANFRKEFEVINLDKLNELFKSGDQVTKESLIEKGLIKNRSSKLIKILGSGKLDKNLTVYADAYSKSAQEAIVKSGGAAHLTQEK
ncbi:50S ribosomal protein L15 [Candidatus Dependentiae bacterium]|nr:50S ribosomal protein L15 [Candidatus Dependentiae bacterium]